MTHSGVKVQSPYKPLYKEIRNKERDGDTNSNSLSSMETTFPNLPSLKEDDHDWQQYLDANKGKLYGILKWTKLYRSEGKVSLVFKYPAHKEIAKESFNFVRKVVEDFTDDPGCYITMADERGK